MENFLILNFFYFKEVALEFLNVLIICEKLIGF